MSEIQDYFENSTVFITGGTGFVGCVLVEKLLRTCKNLKRIYLLIRPKKNLTESERFETLCNTPVFDKLKVENPEFLNKMVLMPGDIMAPKLGLSEKNIEILNSEVNCILYTAASVHFLEKLRSSFDSNVRAVQEIIKIAKNISNLTSMVYVSTAFTNMIRPTGQKEFDETFYDGFPYTFQQLESLFNKFDDELIERIRHEVLKGYPNVYVFNKSLAEEVIRKDGQGLPIAVVKPSMITPTIRDPFPGWVNNNYGIISIFLISLTGFIRALLVDSKCYADMVPADYVANLIIASAWDISKKHRNIKSEAEEQSSIPIYHCVNVSQNPITWGKSLSLLRKHYYDPSSSKMVPQNIFIPTKNTYEYFVLKYAAIVFPAYLKDFLRFCFSKPILYSKIREKQYKFLDVLQDALLGNWNFTDTNSQNLWKSLSMKDKEIYNFNISDVDWNTYCKITVEGIRTHLIKNKL